MEENQLENEVIEQDNDKQQENDISNQEQDDNQLTVEKVMENRNKCIGKVTELLDNYIESEETIDKANKLSYWLTEYCKYLQYEETFRPDYLKQYKRGDIIKANFGYNVDKELGGLHYCVVLDNKNSKFSNTLTVIPLTSIKEGKTYKFPNIVLGNEIYSNLQEKHDKLEQRILNEASECINSKDTMEPQKYLVAINKIMQNLRFLITLEDEISGMKSGSVARINQIRTISKLRIYDPKKNFDILSGIKLSVESLDLIDKAIIQLYTKH